MGLRGPDGRFIKSPRLEREAKSDSDSEKSNPATPQMDTTQITEGTQSRSNPTTPTTKTSGSFGRGRPKLVRSRQSPGSLTVSTESLGPLTIITENMTDTDIDRIIEDAKQNDTELFIKDLNGKITHNYNNTVHGGEENKEKNNLETETSDLELISNLSSSTEIEQETKEHNLRRSKRLTKTNPIIRFNNPITSDYRKHRKQTKRPEDTRNRGRHSGKDQQHRILNDTTEGPVQAEQLNRTADETRTTANIPKLLWTENRHKEQASPIGQLSSNRGAGSEVIAKELELEDKS